MFLVPVTPRRRGRILDAVALLRDGSASWPTTSWTLVIAARERKTPVGQRALNELCRRYASPVYAYVRRRGHGTDDAADLTQDFFAQLLSRDGLAKVEPEGGRFRSFLRVAIDRHLTSHYRASTSQKRGGESNPVSFDWLAAEQGYEQLDPGASPDEVFDLSWAMVIRKRALAKLEAYYDTENRRTRWHHLHRFATTDPDPGDYAQAAAALDTRETAIRKAVDRMRKKLADYVAEEVGDTVSTEEMREAELALVNGR